METTSNPTRTQVLSLLLAVMVALSATAGLAGLASAASTTDLTVSITDSDNTLVSGETTTVEIAVANADGGVGAAELGVELTNPDVAEITDVTVLNSGGNTDNAIATGGEWADVRYAFFDSPDTGSVSIVKVTLKAEAAGTTDVELIENGETGNLVVFDEDGTGYTLDTVGSATLTVVELGPVCAGCETPTDMDDDGLYEDVNGDGQFTFFDVLTLYDHFQNADSPVVAPFDFDGNGDLTFFDVLSLYDKFQS